MATPGFTGETSLYPQPNSTALQRPSAQGGPILSLRSSCADVWGRHAEASISFAAQG